MSLRWRSLLAICALGSYLPSATAHPHSWIDMVSRLEMAPPHQLKALHLAWLFDEFYSATILDEAKEKKHTVDQELAEFARDTIRHLSTEHYLNRITLDGKKLDFGQPYNVKASLLDGQIRLDYSLPLQPVADLSGHRLEFSIYDSTFYVDMRHGQAKAIELIGAGAPGCKATLIQPTPTKAQQSYAASLDLTAQSDDGLGKYFAERVVVTCPAAATP